MTRIDSRTHRAALQVAPGRMEVREFPRPVTGDGEVLVRITRTAVCGSDLHSIYDGLGYLNEEEPTPGRPGHEAVGTVVESRSSDLSAGDRVLVLTIGTFAELVAVPASECIPLPDGPGDDVMVTAQQLGVVLFGLRSFWPAEQPPESAAVLGMGPVGYLFAAELARRGTGTVVVSDLSESRLAHASSAGATHTAHVPRESVISAALAATDGRGADLVIEAAGSDAARADCISSVRTGGKVGFFGYPETYEDAPFPYSTAFWRAPLTIEIAVRAQAEPGLLSFRSAVDLLLTGQLDISPLTAATFPFSELQSALDHFRDRQSVKVQLDMSA